ncbi:hypothetical protein MMC08_009067, partial [Hypocenomyce scalaris]|nr:hypothetical protein [Hypocenomyce scalaris]
MQCDICRRSSSSKLPFNCATCAQSTLYETRIEQAQTLLQRENVGNEISGILQASSNVNTPSSLSREDAPSTKNWEVERTTSAKLDSIERTQAILSHTDALRIESKVIRESIAKRKALLDQRRSDYESASHNLSQRRAVTLEPVENGIIRTQARWDALHARTAESRVFLCREAANLYGLQQRKRKRGVLGRDNYIIGGVPIVDLRDLN